MPRAIVPRVGTDVKGVGFPTQCGLPLTRSVCLSIISREMMADLPRTEPNGGG